MTVNYKKLLPVNIQNTRWGQLIEAFQDLIVNNVKSEKIDIIKKMFILFYK